MTDNDGRNEAHIVLNVKSRGQTRASSATS